MKQLVFGLHLPVIGLSNRSSNINNNSGSKKNGEMEMRQQSFTREQILSIAKKAESLEYDSLSVNDHIVYRTSWLDALSTLSAVAAVTNKIKLGTSILNIVVRSPVICANSLAAIDILSSGRLFAAGVGPGSLTYALALKSQCLPLGLAASAFFIDNLLANSNLYA